MIIRKIDDLYIIKIMKENIKDFDFFDQDKIKDLFQKIIIKIKKKYNIKGLLDVNVYINEYYGMIIEIESIYSYFDEIDMRIHFHLDCTFLQEINENDLLKEKEVYYYKNKYYSIYTGTTDSNIIYKTDDIFNKCIRVMIRKKVIL